MKTIILALAIALATQSLAAEQDRTFLADNGRTIVVVKPDGTILVYGDGPEGRALAAKLRREQDAKRGLVRT